MRVRSPELKSRKVAVTADRAPQHRSKLVKEFLRNNQDIRMIYLPKGSPYLNAMEGCWHQGKRVLLVSEYYKTFQDMRRGGSFDLESGTVHLPCLTPRFTVM